MRRRRVGWFVRLSLTAALSLALSGAPPAIAAAARMVGPCQQECDGAPGSSGCPSTCTDGVCAKVVPATIDAAPGCDAVPERSERCLSDDVEPVAPPPGDGVFHPPSC